MNKSMFNNSHCPCTYSVHDSCWSEYAAAKGDDITCPMCRKRLLVRIKPTPVTQSSLFHSSTGQLSLPIRGANTTTPLITRSPRNTMKKIIAVAIGVVATIIICAIVIFAI